MNVNTMAKKMNDHLFGAIKTLIVSGSSIEEIAKFLKLSHETVARVKRSETFEEYKQMCAAISANYRAKQKAAKTASEPVNDVQHVEPAEPPKKAVSDARSYYLDNRIIGELHRQNEQLKDLYEYVKLMSNKMSELLECWQR